MEANDPLESRAAPELAPLPPHDILDEIGRDAFRRRARDVLQDRIVALHSMCPSLVPPEQVGAFLHEMRAAALVRHPHILPILAVGLREGRPCYTTTLAVNGSLRERPRPFADGRDAAALIEQLAEATAAAHAHGLIHGNLAPGKVLFDENDQPLIGGFGLAPFFFSFRQETGAIIGDPHYLAPEQSTGRPDAPEPATDIWGLGALLYDLLTGRPPIQGTGATEATRYVLRHDPTPPHQLRPGLDGNLEAIVVRCLEKRPADRYASARALAEDLERWRLGRPTAARPLTLTKRLLRMLGRGAR